MGNVWCVRHRDGWCAVAGNMKPAEDASSIHTACDHYVVLPLGTSKRHPTCDECLAALARPAQEPQP